MAIQMGQAVPRRSVNLEGPVLVPHSLAHVNRELALALMRRGVDIGLLTTEPDRPELFAAERFGPLSRCPAYPEPEVVLRHRWPPDFGPAGDAFLVQLIHWEYGAIPRVWLDAIQAHVNEIWVLSNAVRETFLRSGLDPERVTVIGGGVDPKIFHPDVPPMELPTAKGFRFLYVGAPLRRKGLDVLLDVYREEFRRDEDVSLVVKDVSWYPDGMRDRLQAAVRDLQGPEVTLLDGDLPATGMPALYTACQALVQPYRAEGLCLPLLEGMAAGIPVAGTAHGASLDYLNASNGFPIPADEIQFNEDRVENLETAGRPFWAEPRRADLRRVMRQMFEEQAAAGQRALAARRDVAGGWTWDQAATVARERLDALFGERDRRLRALSFFVDGSAALEAERPREACARLEAALALEPCFPFALSEYGVALVQLGHLDEARRILEQALEIDPDLDEARNNLAVVASLMAQHGAAESGEMAA